MIKFTTTASLARARLGAVLAASLLSGALPAAGVAAAATVEVRLTGVASARGQVRVAVCDRQHFLKKCAYTASAPARTGQTVVRVNDIPAGTWAVLAYQDANDNGELDRNAVGIPSEDYGFSRDAAGKFGPPSFDAAAMELPGGLTVVPIRLH